MLTTQKTVIGLNTNKTISKTFNKTLESNRSRRIGYDNECLEISKRTLEEKSVENIGVFVFIFLLEKVLVSRDKHFVMVSIE